MMSHRPDPATERGANHPTRRGIRGILDVPEDMSVPRLWSWRVDAIPLEAAARQHFELNATACESAELVSRLTGELEAAKRAATLAATRREYGEQVLTASAEVYAATHREVTP